MTEEPLAKIERLEAEVAALKDDRLPRVDRASKRRDRRQVLGGFGMFLVAALWASMLSASALAGSNTVTSDDIVDNGIYHTDIRDNTLRGADISESTLVLTCPAGYAVIGDICAGPLRAADTLSDAGGDCADERLRLPSVTEARAIGFSAHGTGFIWTDTHYFYNATNPNFRGVTTSGPSLSWADDATTNVAYRCVTTVGARP